jgi:lysophospholipase L1-like esterase
MTRRASLALGVAAASLGLLALAEGTARVLHPEPPPRAWRSHLLLGFVRAPGFKAPKVAIDTGEPFTFEANPLGFRSRTLNTLEKGPGVYRIVFIGGSTTYNVDLPHEHTFPGIVEAKLEGRGVEVANAGLPGATTNAVVAELVHAILPLRPDLVLCLDPVLNDFHESLRADWDPSMRYLAADPPQPGFLEWLAGRSRFLSLFDTRAAEAPNAHALLARRARACREDPVCDPDPSLLLRGLEHFETMERVLLELCQAEHIACGLITEPALLKPDMSPAERAVVSSTAIVGTRYNLRPETELAALEAYNETTRRNAAAHGGLLVDAERIVPKDLEHYFDDVHLTTRGNEVIARAVLDAIAPVISR